MGAKVWVALNETLVWNERKESKRGKDEDP